MRKQGHRWIRFFRPRYECQWTTAVVATEDGLAHLGSAHDVREFGGRNEQFAHGNGLVGFVKHLAQVLERVNKVDVILGPRCARGQDVVGGLVEVDETLHTTFWVGVSVECEYTAVRQAREENHVNLALDAVHDFLHASPEDVHQLLAHLSVAESRTTTGDPITDPVFDGCTISTTAGGAPS